MTCQQCDAEATFHLTQNVGGQSRELHLCTGCAVKRGLIAGPALKDLQLDVVVESLLASQLDDSAGALARSACSCCGIRFMQFRAEGKLGCPNDYDVFAAGLEPLLRRYHGASRHVGKRLRKGSAGDARALLKLRRRLRTAVDREDFESAARLRDQIRASTRNRQK